MAGFQGESKILHDRVSCLYFKPYVCTYDGGSHALLKITTLVAGFHCCLFKPYITHVQSCWFSLSVCFVDHCNNGDVDPRCRCLRTIHAWFRHCRFETTLKTLLLLRYEE